MSNYCIECLCGCLRVAVHTKVAQPVATGVRAARMARIELMKAVEQRIAAKHFRGARGFVPSMFNHPPPVKTHSILAVSSLAKPTAIHRCSSTFPCYLYLSLHV